MWMHSLGCKGKLVKGHPSSQSMLSLCYASLIWIYTISTNSSSHLFCTDLLDPTSFICADFQACWNIAHTLPPYCFLLIKIKSISNKYYMCTYPNHGCLLDKFAVVCSWCNLMGVGILLLCWEAAAAQAEVIHQEHLQIQLKGEVCRHLAKPVPLRTDRISDNQVILKGSLSGFYIVSLSYQTQLGILLMNEGVTLRV